MGLTTLIKQTYLQLIGGTAPSGSASSTGDISQMIKYLIANAGNGRKVSGSGYLVYPAAAAGIDPANAGSAWANGAWSEVVSSTAQANFIVGLTFTFDASSGTIEADIAIGTGAAASETEVSAISVALMNVGGVTTESTGVIMFPHAIPVATATRIAVRVRSSNTTLEPNNIRLIYVKQSELVSI